jgi:hypothetical protein
MSHCRTPRWSRLGPSIGLPLMAFHLAVTPPDAHGTRAEKPSPARATTLRVGERLAFDVKYGALKVGTAMMEVRGLTDVRGRGAWHTVFAVTGGVPFYRVDDRHESWIDTVTFSALRLQQRTKEGKRRRVRDIEVYPERGVYVDARDSTVDRPTVDQPLDEGSFLYFLRTIPLEVGESYAFNRYFKPDRNPVQLTVLRRERVQVPAGTFDAIVVKPTIKTNGIFSENGQAEVWLTDDDRHLVVQMRAKLSFGSISMQLRELQSGEAP